MYSASGESILCSSDLIICASPAAVTRVGCVIIPATVSPSDGEDAAVRPGSLMIRRVSSVVSLKFDIEMAGEFQTYDGTYFKCHFSDSDP